MPILKEKPRKDDNAGIKEGQRIAAGEANPYVLKDDAKFEIPETIYWNTETVAEWIVAIGYPQYRECFTTNFISGRHFIYMDASALPKIGIYDFEHIKDIAGQIRELINLDHIIKDFKKELYDPFIGYLETKRHTGARSYNSSYEFFTRRWKRFYGIVKPKKADRRYIH